MIEHVGFFQKYTPSPLPFGPGALYCKNAADEDWYEIVAAAVVGFTWVMHRGDRVVSVTGDPSAIFPAGCDVYRTDQAGVERGMVLNGAGDAFVAAPVPFPVLSRVQLVAALEIDLGKTEADVDAAIAAMPEGTQAEIDAKTHARIAWKNGTRFERDVPLVVQLIPDLGLTAATVDPVWRSAAENY